MSRKFIATILAASLAVTSLTAAPAKAGNDDLVKFLAGATALIIIGKAIHDKNNGSVVTRHDTRRYDTNRHDNRRHDTNRHDNRRYDNHRRDNRHEQRNARRHDRKLVPAACRVDVNTRQGTVRGYGYRCVQNYPRVAANLPGRCLTNVRSRGHTRLVYTKRCLARSGYRAF